MTVVLHWYVQRLIKSDYKMGEFDVNRSEFYEFQWDQQGYYRYTE